MWCCEEKKTRNVIIDVDVGTDDAWAVLMILKFEKKFNIKVQAITCVHGNTDVKNVAKNLIRVLKTIDRLDVPIYLGADEMLIPVDKFERCDQFHGCNGFCDYQFDDEVDINGIVRKEHAVNAMKQILMEHKNTSLICIGPLTNLALLLKMYPEVKAKICKTYIMGGNWKGVGNMTRAAEFNFFGDPEAAYIVFDSLKTDIVLLPWETCVEENMAITMEWRLNTLGGITNPITDLLNPIDKKCNKNYTTWMPCDVFLAALFIDSDVVRKSNDYHVTIELNGRHTRGQVVIDHLFQEKVNCTIVELLDEDLFKKMILYTAGHKKVQ